MTITPQMAEDAQKKQDPSLAGHLDTHFDGMDMEFPLAYTKREGTVFDVSTVRGRDIALSDIAAERIEAGMFVAFYTGFIEEVGYGNEGYFSAHPQLSVELIDTLLQKGVSIIGLDFAGVRRRREHTLTDQRCAERGTFIIENLCNLKAVVDEGGTFVAHTYPMKLVGVTGLPCRVIAELP